MRSSATIALVWAVAVNACNSYTPEATADDASTNDAPAGDAACAVPAAGADPLRKETL